MRVAQSYLVDSHVGPRKRSAYNYLKLPSYCTVADEKLCLSNKHYSDPPAPADSIGISPLFNYLVGSFAVLTSLYANVQE